MPVFVLRVILTLVAALGAALLFVRLAAPIPWMIGPLLVTALSSMLGAPTRSWSPARNAAQWTIATTLGLYFTPHIVQLIGSVWWAILLSILLALTGGVLAGKWLLRVHGDRMGVPRAQQRATCFFASAVGGASEMTLLAEREGARTDLVAAAHSLRLVIVSVAIPFAFAGLGLRGSDVFVPAIGELSPVGLVLLATITAAAALLLHRLGLANPWFMGPLLASMALTLGGVQFSAMPTPLVNAAQLVIGVSLGVRFQAEFLRAAPRWMFDVALTTVALIAVSALFALLLSWVTGVSTATLVLGTAPGGIAEMAITAQALKLGVPLVTTFQVCRVIAVLVLIRPIYVRWVARQ